MRNSMKLLLTLIALASAKSETKLGRPLESIDNNNPFKEKPTTGLDGVPRDFRADTKYQAQYFLLSSDNIR